MIFAVFDPSPLTLCINCSFFTYIFAVLLPDSSRQYCQSVWRIFLKMNTRHPTRKPVKKCNYWGRFSKWNSEEGQTASECQIFGDRFNHRRDFDFSRRRSTPSWIFKFLKFFTVTRLKRAELSVPPCQIWSKSVKTRPRYGDISIFQDVGHPPSWLCCACVQTTHEGYLVVFIAVQKFGWNWCNSFDACFSFFQVLLENAYSRPPKFGF